MLKINTFTAPIEKIVELHNDCRYPDENFQIFKFSRSKILFTKKQKKAKYFFPLQNDFPIHNGIKYNLDKIYDSNDKKKFSIKIDNKESLFSFIAITRWNRIKCNYIHGYYLLYKDREYYFKTIISILIGAIISYFVGSISYKKGYQDAMKQTSKQILNN